MQCGRDLSTDLLCGALDRLGNLARDGLSESHASYLLHLQLLQNCWAEAGLIERWFLVRQVGDDVLDASGESAGGTLDLKSIDEADGLRSVDRRCALHECILHVRCLSLNIRNVCWREGPNALVESVDGGLDLLECASDSLGLAFICRRSGSKAEEASKDEVLVLHLEVWLRADKRRPENTSKFLREGTNLVTKKYFDINERVYCERWI